MTFISGNTYVNRHLIKPMGFTWNKRSKVWERTLPLTPDEESTLAAISGIMVDNHEGVLIDNTAPKRRGNSTFTRSHKEIYGRCEDAPCCGCCGPQFYGSMTDY